MAPSRSVKPAGLAGHWTLAVGGRAGILGDGTLEEGQARVHGGALDEANHGEDQHDVAEPIKIVFPARGCDCQDRLHRIAPT
eukprot:1372718-Rhodomonas_salina.3